MPHSPTGRRHQSPAGLRAQIASLTQSVLDLEVAIAAVEEESAE